MPRGEAFSAPPRGNLVAFHESDLFAWSIPLEKRNSRFPHRPWMDRR
jgi:hypothetical protein